MGSYIERIKGIFNLNNNSCVKIEEKRYPTISFQTGKVKESKLVEDYKLKKMKEIKFGDEYCLSDILEVLLLKLGLQVNDAVRIDDIKYVSNEDNGGCDYVVDLTLNDVYLYKLIFRYKGIYDMRPMVIFVKDNETYGYNMMIHDIKNGFIDLREVFYECYTEYGIYHRDYSYFEANFMIKWGYYCLNLCLRFPKGYLHDVKKFNYILDNEDKLKDYLMSLVFPLRIDEVYKILERDFLGDISKYSFVELECMTFDHFLGEDVLCDKILVCNGEWKSFGMTRGNKTVMLDSNGEWSYRLLDSNMEVRLSMNIEEYGVNYTIHGRTKEELDKYVSSYVIEDIKDANVEVDKTKQLVKYMFEREGKSYDR